MTVVREIKHVTFLHSEATDDPTPQYVVVVRTGPHEMPKRPTSDELIATLSEQIDGLMSGEISPAEARAAVKAVDHRIKEVESALRVARLGRKLGAGK